MRKVRWSYRYLAWVEPPKFWRPARLWFFDGAKWRSRMHVDLPLY